MPEMKYKPNMSNGEFLTTFQNKTDQNRDVNPSFVFSSQSMVGCAKFWRSLNKYEKEASFWKPEVVACVYDLPCLNSQAGDGIYSSIL